MLDRRWRHGVERGSGPLGRGLRGLGVPADALTVFGLLASVATAFLIASGHLVLGRRRCDRRRRERPARRCDRTRERLRRAHAARSSTRSPTASPTRCCSAASPGTSPAGSPYESILAFAVAACSMLVSYERARAEALGPRRARRADGARRAVRVPRRRRSRSTSSSRCCGSCSCSPRSPRCTASCWCTARPRTRRACTPAASACSRDERLLPDDERAGRSAPAPLRCEPGGRPHSWAGGGRGPDAPPPPVGAPQLASLSRARPCGAG